MLPKRMQNTNEKAKLEWLKIVSSFTSVMQVFHRMRIYQNKRNIKKLQKLNPNKYIQKDFHKSRSKITHY